MNAECDTIGCPIIEVIVERCTQRVWDDITP
jgi:hypothetical protein